jgi:hypothetical protein
VAVRDAPRLYRCDSRRAGAPAYRDLRERALEIDLGGPELAVAGRDDLISMKRASGRPVDLDDLAALTEPEHRAGSVFPDAR